MQCNFKLNSIPLPSTKYSPLSIRRDDKKYSTLRKTCTIFKYLEAVKSAINILASRPSATDQTSYHMDFGYSLKIKYLQS